MRPRSRSDFASAIICALTLEADAVEALFDETYDRLGKIYGKQPGDANAYINGRIGKHSIVLCYTPGMGIGSAASVASSLQVSYTGVRLALVVGICGGAPYPSSDQNIFLGDVIVSDSVVEYDFGRQYPSGFQRKADVRDILGRPDREIRTLLAGLQARRTRIEFQDQMSQHLCIIQQSETQWQHPGSEDVLYGASHYHKHFREYSTVKCCCFDGDKPENVCNEALEESCSTLGCDERQTSRRLDSTAGVKISVHIGKVASANTVMNPESTVMKLSKLRGSLVLKWREPECGIIFHALLLRGCVTMQTAIKTKHGKLMPRQLVLLLPKPFWSIGHLEKVRNHVTIKFYYTKHVSL